MKIRKIFSAGVYELPQARELARAQKKWLLVSIQQVDAFESLRLNRDIWKAEVVQVSTFGVLGLCHLIYFS